MLRRLRNINVLGNDIFISYTRADAINYAAGLANELTARDFSCFIDQWGTPPGKELPPSLKKALKKSYVFVLIGSEGAIKSYAVESEIREFLKTGNDIIPIDFESALEKAPWIDAIAGIPRTPEAKTALISGKPSDTVVNRIVNTFRYTKKNQRVRRSFMIAAILLLLLGGASIYAAVDASRQQRLAVKAAHEASQQQQNAALATGEAQRQQHIAESARYEAGRQQMLAVENAKIAKRQERLAKDNLKKAQEQEALATQNAEEARKQYEFYLYEKARKESLELSDSAVKGVGTNNLKHKLILAVNAAEKAPTDQAYSALKNNLQLLFRELKLPALSSDARYHKMVISQDGEKLALTSPYGDIELFHLKTGAHKSLAYYIQPIENCAFSPDGAYLFAVNNGITTIWDADEGKLISELDGEILSFPGKDVATQSTCIVVAAKHPTQKLQLWRLPAGALLTDSLEVDRFIKPEIFIDGTKGISIICEGGYTKLPPKIFIINNQTGKVVWTLLDTVGATKWAYIDQSLIGYSNYRPENPEAAPVFWCIDIGAEGIPRTIRNLPVDSLMLVHPIVKKGLMAQSPAIVQFYEDAIEFLLNKKYAQGNLIYFSGRIWVSCDGSFVVASDAAGGGKSTLRIFSLPDLTVRDSLSELKIGDIDMIDIRFSPDSNLYAVKWTFNRDSDITTGFYDKWSIWDAKTKKKYWERLEPELDYKFSKDGTRMVMWHRKPVTGSHKNIYVFESRTGRLISQLDYDSLEMYNVIDSGRDGDVSLYLSTGPIIYIDSSAARVVFRTLHTAYVWDVDANRIINKMNIFGEKLKIFDRDNDLISKPVSLDELMKIAKRRLSINVLLSP